MGKPLDRLPAVPTQTGVVRMVTCLMALQSEQLVTDDEYMTIRARIAQWDFKHDERGAQQVRANARRAVTKAA